MTAEAPPTTATKTDNPYGEGEFGEVMRERDEAREHAEALAEALKRVLSAIEAGTPEVEPDIFDAEILQAEAALANYEEGKPRDKRHTPDCAYQRPNAPKGDCDCGYFKWPKDAE
jgi:hypothetical protein